MRESAIVEWNESRVSRCLKDLIKSEWQQQRANAALPEAFLSDPFQSLAQHLGADSLEIYQIATKVAVFFELHKSDREIELLDAPSIHSWQRIILESRNTYDQTLVFSTSGSTGQPKYITHSLDDLIEEAEFWSKQLERPERILSVVPCHHLYGFIFTQLLPEIWQVPLVDCRDLMVTGLAKFQDEKSLLVGFPTYWQTLVKFGIQLSSGLSAVTSTAPCTPELENGLRGLGLRQFWHIYGSSETAGVGWKETAESPFTLLPAWSFDDENDSQLVRVKSDERVPLQDKVRRLDERRFEVVGRLDDAVQVGGVNVYPNYVAKMISQLEGVEAAKVRLMKPHEGDRLKAYVIPAQTESDYQALLTRIEQFCDQYLKPVERPRAIRVGEAFPINEMGKSLDWDL